MTTPTPIIERRATYARFQTRELAVSGSGPTVVLLHGFMHSASAWRPVLERLSEIGQQAVAIDLPGFGQADSLRDGPLLPQIDRFVEQVVRHHGRDSPVVLVGNSLGSAAATRAARNRSLPVGAVMPTDSAGLTWTRLTSMSPAVPLVIGASRRLPKRLHRSIFRQVVAPILYGTQSAIDWAMIDAPDTVVRHIRNLVGRSEY